MGGLGGAGDRDGTDREQCLKNWVGFQGVQWR